MSNINDTIRKSVSVNFIGRYSNVAIQIVVTALLARMLSPADFGVIAVVSVLVTFFAFLSEMGLGPAVVQFRDLSERQLSALFWLTVAVGAAIAVVFMSSGTFISSFYHDARYVRIALALGISVAASCWGIVPLALLRKGQRFRSIVIIEVMSAALSGVLAIVAAYGGAGVFALVVKSNAYALLMFGLCFVACRPKIFVRPSFEGMRRILSYSGYQFLFNIVNYFTRNLDKLLIGKLMGPVLLGVYDMSYRLMLMPVSNLTHVISPALQPVYSAHQNDHETIFRSYQQVVRVLAIAGGFVGIVSFSCAHEIIRLIYGPKWTSAEEIFSILALSIVIQVILSSSGAIFGAIGRTDLLSFSGILSATCTIGAIVIGAYTGSLTILSWLLVCSFALNAVQGFTILVRIGFRRSVFELFRPSAGCLAGVAILLAACALLGHVEQHIVVSALSLLVVKVIGVSVFYLALLVMTGDVRFLHRAVSRKRTSGAVTAGST